MGKFWHAHKPKTKGILIYTGDKNRATESK